MYILVHNVAYVTADFETHKVSERMCLIFQL